MVKKRGLFTVRAGDAFAFFLLDFKLQKDGNFQLVEPNLEKRQFPRLVSLGARNRQTGLGSLGAPARRPAAFT